MRRLFLAGLIAWLSIHTIGAAMSASLPAIPEMILGVNQAGVGTPEKIQEPSRPLWPLTDADLERLKVIGTNTVRFPLYPEEVGIPRHWFVWKTGDSFDRQAASKVTPDWRALDAVIDQLASHGLTPYICPHPVPTSWITIYIPEDAERCFWFTGLVARHVHEKYGDNAIFGWYENIWKNSMEPWMSGDYKHLTSARFPSEWHRMLRSLYGNRIERLNRTWKSSFSTFDEISIPEMGNIRGVPESAHNSRRTWDLRRAIDLLSRERLTGWRAELRKIAPGAMWAGACLHDGFNGMWDTRSGNPPKCNWGIRTHVKTSDALAADNYTPPSRLKVAYRTIAKIASTEGKRFMAVEVNAMDTRAFPALAEVGGPIRGALVWCGREDAFGLIAADGTPREKSIAEIGKLFRTLATRGKVNAVYKPGDVYVYYPEETYECAVLRASHLDAFEHVCDAMPVSRLEPVLTSEIDKLPSDAPIFVLEECLPRQTIDALNKLGSRVVCPHPYFVDENGQKVERAYKPTDFYAELRRTKDGAALMEAFQRVEEKEHNIAFRDLGTTTTIPSELNKANEIDPSRPYDPMDLIDGDSVASRVVFADKAQDERIDLTLPTASTIYGAFVETAYEDPGRTPKQVTIQVSTDGQTWITAGTTHTVTADRIHLRFAPIPAKYIRIDLGQNTDAVGTRLMEVGVLGR